MKSARFCALLFGSTVLLSGSVFAGPANKKPLHLYENIAVAGKQLAPGDYKIEWTDNSGSDVQVSILQGKDTVAAFSARIVPVTNPNIRDAYTTQARQDGSKALKELFFTGKKYELQVGDASSATGTQTSAGQPN